VADYGTEAKQAQILPSLCADSFEPGSLAIVEPRFDFDPLEPRTTARRDSDGFVIDGVKALVPWLDGTGPVLVIAAEDEAPQAFLVPRGAEGLTATPEASLGLAGLPTVELRLDGVRVPVDGRLGGDTGSDIAALVDRGRVAMAAAGVGLARASFEIARDYAKEREAFGAPIATKQAIAFKLADMAIEIDAARLLTWEAAWLLDQGQRATREARLAADKARRTALQAADGAVQVLGGHGYIRDHLPEMHLRNAGGFRSFEAMSLL
jgi:alkylation response protein AidB-like acyl-CoA dehydrogenase